MIALLDVLVVALAGFSVLWLVDRQRRHGKHLPPGPKGLPFIGNLLQIPAEREHVAFKKTGAMHGNVCNPGLD